MASKKTNTPEFSEPEEVVDEVIVDAAPEKEVVAPGAPATKKARINGTWRMHWGNEIFDFENGKTYTIPVGLYEHLRIHGNIYDTL